MSDATDSFHAFIGQYTGEGRWVDIAGESKRYRVTQEVSAEPDGLLVTYRHEFFEEGNSTQGRFARRQEPLRSWLEYLECARPFHSLVGDAFFRGVSHLVSRTAIHQLRRRQFRRERVCVLFVAGVQAGFRGACSKRRAKHRVRRSIRLSGLFRILGLLALVLGLCGEGNSRRIGRRGI
jgi:hypothetical protein